jgi:predicted DNA binding protein
MIDARFRIRLPPDTWVREVSESLPTARFRLLSGVRTGETAVELGEVVADDPEAAGRRIADHPSISDYERLEADDERLLGKYETADTGLYEFVERSAVPPEFPVVVRNGWYEFDLTGTREEFDRVRAALEESGREYELLSIVGESASDGLVTDRQRELLDAALREGYFEVPRECTLADLADSTGVDKSTASRVLRRGETEVLRWYLTTVEGSADHPREP